MRTLKLDIDQLSVESFDTTSRPAGRGPGTVFGHEETLDEACTSTCVTNNPVCPATNSPNGNTCGAVCTALQSYGACSGAYTCNAASCATHCGTGGNATYPPYQTCDNYQDTCADGCMW